VRAVSTLVPISGDLVRNRDPVVVTSSLFFIKAPVLGVALAVIDATIVRALVLPVATMKLLGRWELVARRDGADRLRVIGVSFRAPRRSHARGGARGARRRRRR
jgi:hypothetical protein